MKTIHNKYPDNVRIVKSICANKERFCIQFLPFLKLLFKYDLVFVEGNPRQVSHFFLATMLRLINRRVVLWTMVHSFKKPSLTENLRLLWTRMFKYILVYNDEETNYLRNKGFRNQYILGINNGLDQKAIEKAAGHWSASSLEKWRTEKGLNDKIVLLSCARLDPKNKFQLMVEALPFVITKYKNLLWCIIGSGEEKDRLLKMIDERNIGSFVHFAGQIYDETDLAPWFMNSEIFIHPAGIGLSLLHSFGYGLPLITEGGEKELQNAEYVSFENGLTGLNYNNGDYKDFAKTIIRLLDDTELRASMKNYTKKIAREKYNVDVMADRFLRIANKATDTKES